MRLSSFRGHKAVALVFYPFAFSGVCTSEMSGIKARLESFLTFDTEVLAISCDPVYTLRTFADADGLNFPLLSDFWPHGEVARAYDVFDEARGCPQRSSYVVDSDGRSPGRCTTRRRTDATSTSTLRVLQGAGLRPGSRDLDAISPVGLGSGTASVSSSC